MCNTGQINMLSDTQNSDVVYLEGQVLFQNRSWSTFSEGRAAFSLILKSRSWHKFDAMKESKRPNPV